jgi:hypothetical protein
MGRGATAAPSRAQAFTAGQHRGAQASLGYVALEDFRGAEAVGAKPPHKWAASEPAARILRIPNFAR